ncbi:MAG TPA: hypothetical protein VNO19_04710 [Gemmatimonadales bacterium]|nr:hypothetical protein [Gemmatimonadales bacterium]
MTPFALFAVLYMTALFLDQAERWTYPLFTLASLFLILVIVSTRITRITFLIFLVVITAQLLLRQFPDVPNHLNIAIYCNLVMMVGIVLSWVRIRDYPSDDDYFEMVRPILQVSTIIVYFLAGFNKLNADFVNPHVSCVKGMTENLVRMAISPVGGIPKGLVLLGAGAVVAYRLLLPRLGQRAKRVAAAVLLSLIAAAVMLAVMPLPKIDPGVTGLAVKAMVALVISWELIGALMLAFPALQLPMLAFSWTMHSSLALIGFVDFGAVALSLLITFVPWRYLALLNSRVHVPWLGLSVHRAYLYLATSILCGIVGFGQNFVAGVVFNLGALVFLWPLLSGLTAPSPRPPWTGVPLSSPLTPKWMYIFPVLVFLHGLTSYLGLRTAGNFSMFSNLRTEGPVSNHFLLRSNPLKLWSYQEDVVSFIDIDDRRAKIGFQYQPLRGNQLPVVEFRKLIYWWTKAGVAVPMTLEYRGKIHSTEDITSDPVWRTETRDWEMVLMDFRSIQPTGPNRCRW